MDQLSVELKNCYGIPALENVFDFSVGPNKPKAYAIYAPNGLMKTSFAKTFEDLASGKNPKEERFSRPTTCVVIGDGSDVSQEMIFVLKAELDISQDSLAITDILVNPESKARYDELLVDIDKKKNKAISALQKKSRVPKKDVEKMILQDLGMSDLSSCIEKARAISTPDDLSELDYATIFDPKVTKLLTSPEFVAKANEFNERYQELFNQAGTIYQKGVFNPTKAEVSFSTLEKQGFFKGGHRVHLRGEAGSISKDELDEKLVKIHAEIDGDESLKKLRLGLAENVKTQALNDLIEELSASQVEFLLEKLKPANQAAFKAELWVFYIHNCSDAISYAESYAESKTEIDEIETAAAEAAPRWTKAVDLFNDRFVDMPFILSVANQSQAALGKENARLKFTFKERDGAEEVECSRQDAKMKTLSQGERRALYLLNFIFEVEARKLAGQETLFIIDDAADSFDYKNKHAIVQYLKDLSLTERFHQIILTHNFDFFRTLANTFVHRRRCLMANRSEGSISLELAQGVKNYFTGMWKQHVASNNCILCATIPFTRNLIEYTKGEEDEGYLTLTSLLHWKKNTDDITVGNYLDIYNGLFGTTHDNESTQSVKTMIFDIADEICTRTKHNGLNLEDKVLLSIASRMQAEIYLTNEIRTHKGDEGYWFEGTSQFGNLVGEYSALQPNTSSLRTLEKVGITVSSNIHLNSFMYEPILDLTIDHLVSLYAEVKALNSPSVVP